MNFNHIICCLFFRTKETIRNSLRWFYASICLMCRAFLWFVSLNQSELFRKKKQLKSCSLNSPGNYRSKVMKDFSLVNSIERRERKRRKTASIEGRKTSVEEIKIIDRPRWCLFMVRQCWNSEFIDTMQPPGKIHKQLNNSSEKGTNRDWPMRLKLTQGTVNKIEKISSIPFDKDWVREWLRISQRMRSSEAGKETKLTKRKLKAKPKQSTKAMSNYDEIANNSNYDEMVKKW